MLSRRRVALGFNERMNLALAVATGREHEIRAKTGLHGRSLIKALEGEPVREAAAVEVRTYVEAMGIGPLSPLSCPRLRQMIDFLKGKGWDEDVVDIVMERIIREAVQVDEVSERLEEWATVNSMRTVKN